MRKMWRKLFTTSAMTFMLCMTWLVITSEAQAERFVDNGNGTVTDTDTDTVTGLMWTKSANPLGELTWNETFTRFSSFSISGIGGWRLPSIGEIDAIYHAMSGGHPFTDVQSTLYWSSETNVRFPDYAGTINMSNGDWGNVSRHRAFGVWPVRASQ
ncbi:DUF1566 domain-containing protein [Desulfonatronum sp. SC1]|uniref:Lcl C-terminal domain-containing protein n=1 Tax=Desulfonatronum sp. SC1 TaxID=2109626 RepID=UPI000D309FDA|nr:DUF1566 domain-containing protein [Desulfonatronum sp. SC1]PTN38259.1 hypothetical protein C6366_03325 [Desulfonatronum sp. SC1]